MRKCTVLLLIVCMVMSSLLVLTVMPATVQAASKPSVPRFSVKFIDNLCDISPSVTTTIDPYTGKEKITTTPGYHVISRTIEVTIKNQPFTPYTDENRNKINLYYVIQSKGHYGDWQGNDTRLVYLDSEYTIWSMSLNDFEDGSKLDFRVDAVIGYMYEFIHPDHPLLVLRTELIGESSGWSSIQTFTLTYKSQSSPSYPSQIASSPENPISTFDDNPVPSTNFVLSTCFLLGIIAILFCVVVVLVLLFISRQRKTLALINSSPQNS